MQPSMALCSSLFFLRFIPPRCAVVCCLPWSAPQLHSEDHNQDGKLTFEEALMLLKHSGGIDVLWVENESYHRKQEL